MRGAKVGVFDSLQLAAAVVVPLPQHGLSGSNSASESLGYYSCIAALQVILLKQNLQPCLVAG